MAENEQKTQTSNEKSKKSLLLIVLVGLAVLAVGLYATMTSSGIDKALVKEQVDAWISHIEAQAPQTKVTYDKIEMVGVAAERHAVIRGVKFQVTEPSAEITSADGEAVEVPEQESQILIPAVELHVDDITFDAFTVRIPEPITSLGYEGKGVILEMKPAIEIAIRQETEDDTHMIYYDQALEGEIVLTPAHEEDTTERMAISIDGGSYSRGNYSLDVSERGKINMQINGMKVVMTGRMPANTVDDEKDDETSQDEDSEEKDEEEDRAEAPESTEITVGGMKIKSEWRDFHEENGAMNILYEIKDINTPDTDDMPYGAISFKLDADYSGPSFGAERGFGDVDWSTKKALVELRELSVKADDAAFVGKLTFQTGQGEMLPVGDGNITIEGFDFILNELREKGQLEEPEEKLISALIKRASAQKLADIKDLSLDLKRESGKSLMIGKAPFEELFAIFLTGGNMPVPPAPVEGQPQQKKGHEGHHHTHPAPKSEKLEEQEVEELFDEQ